MSFEQLKTAIKYRFMADSTSITDHPTPNKSLRSSATCPNFSFGDVASLSSPSISSSSTSSSTPKTSTASAGDWGSREHYLKLAFLTDSNSY